MSKTVHSVKLQAYASVDLDRISYSGGDIVYDKTNGTLRVMDGETPGGGKLATQLWVQNSAGTITANLKGDIYTAGGLRVLDNGTTLANPAFFGDVYASNGTSKILDNGTDGTNALFTGSLTGNVTGNLTGNVTGNLTGNVTGNVTGNLTGNVTGNADTATKLAATKNINNVAFDGSANITLSTLVNGTKTITLNSSGNLVIPGASGGGLISSTGYNYLSTVGSLIIDGDQVALDYRGNNNLFVDEFGIEFYTNSTGTSGFNASISADNHWAFAPDGTTYLPGNITMPSGTVNASAVTTTNDVTVGGNAVISTAPTLTTHATNKKYVDKKATAMSIALS